MEDGMTPSNNSPEHVAFRCLATMSHMTYVLLAADDHSAAHADSSRLWEHRRSRIKALDDKFRWKLNELGVRHNKCHQT